MKKKIFAALTVVTICSTMFITFHASAEVQPDPVEIIEIRWRRDRYIPGECMQCVDFSLRKCEYVVGM